VPAAATMAARSMSDSAKARALVQAKAVMDESTKVPGWTSKSHEQGLTSKRRHSTTAMGTAPALAEGLDVCIDCYLSGGNLNALRVHSGEENSTFEREQQQRLRYSNDISSLVLLASTTARHFSKSPGRVGAVPPRRDDAFSRKAQCP